MNILGIESSCDETAAAVVQDGEILLSNVVASQTEIHKKYGGVVPEVAARSHIEVINPVIDQALAQAFPDDPNPWDSIDAIAVTYGPGLSGSLLVGTMAARTLALIKNKPLYPVNHVVGHVYANYLQPLEKTPDWQPPVFPLLALIVSGLHSQLALFTNHFEYTLLGQTQDDAVGEAFDKVSRIIGLGYPGGPAIEKAGLLGDPQAYSFPKARMTKRDITIPAHIAKNLTSTAETNGAGELVVQGAYDFSFSGLKTAVLRQIQREVGVGHDFPSFELAARLNESQVQNIAASFNRVAAETLVEKTLTAFREFSPETVVIAGGVAANQELRKQLQAAIPLDIQYAAMNLCTDNAAMIATLGHYAAQQRDPSNPHEVAIQPSLAM